jgi:N-acetylglucosamine kinase-like BadF-type ATPase
MVTGQRSADGLILAVDGGASKTDVWLVTTDGEVTGCARGEGSNHQFSGLDGAMAALDDTIGLAVADAGGQIGRLPVAATGVYCLAGVDLAVDEARLTEAIGSRGWTATGTVLNDSLAVLRAGVRSGWGVGVVCGTGLNCVGLGVDGSVVRFPSLGELSGDLAAGGSWLGVRALGLALRSGDGRGEPTMLAELVPAHFGLSEPEEVLERVYSGDIGYGRLFELAEVCTRAAAAGDQVARGAVGFLAGEVVAMVTATARRLAVEGDELEVVLGGGLFDAAYSEFAERVEIGVRATVPRARFRRLDAAPVLGAALLGLDQVGAPPAAAERLRAAARTTADTAPA